MLAVHNMDLKMSKQLVEEGAKVLTPMDKGVTLFHMAAANNDVRLLDFAIGRDDHASLDLRTDDGWTPAQHAAITASFDALNLLLEHGADPLCRNAAGLTMYDHIVGANHVELLEIFWNEAMAYDRSRDVKRLASCGLIHRAAGAPGPECLDYILERNPGNEKNVAMQYNNEYEQSLPLHYAVMGANQKNVQTLLGLMKSKPPPKQPKGKKNAQ